MTRSPKTRIFPIARKLKGWKFLYLPQIECASELPVDMNGFKSQQARLAKGLMQTAKKICQGF